MFFQGTLQEGIAAALQQSKQVVCFVTDEDEESQQWEHEFLADDSVKPYLNSQAVTLRLKAESEEAGYLEALFPVPRKPTVIVIQNGQLREYIAAGTEKEDFQRRLSLALGGPSTQTSPTTATSASQASEPTQSAQATSTDFEDPGEDEDDDLYGDVAPAPSYTNATASRTPVRPAADPPLQSNPQLSGVPTAPSPASQNVIQPQVTRSRADEDAQKTAAETDAEKRTDNANETRPDDSQARNPSAAENSYASMLRKKKQEANEERQRILKRIEDDRQARRKRETEEREARRLLSANAESESANDEAAQSMSSVLPPSRGPGKAGEHCNLQIRLLDGSTMRNRFSSSATLANQVRAWIDADRTDGGAPYTFRIVLTPLTNKAIEPGEESGTLADLGLAPSSTLVLVPKLRVANAFQQSGGLLFRGWLALYSLLMAILGFPGRMFGNARGVPGQRVDRNGPGEDIPMENLDGRGSARQTSAQRGRIGGFQNMDDLRRRDQQLYNGNSLNFEPRRDEDDQSDS